jgi:hypothetical protein
MSAHRLIIALSIGISILGIVCTNGKPVAGIEITNGNCVGTIYHADGAVADGAVVRLIPRDYNPFSPSDSPIDSTVTDKNGRFSFMIKQLRRYNIIAQKASVSCMDSIELIPNVTTIVTDTLRASGFISGAVRLQKPDTTNSIVILIMGTNVYAMPSDTSGKFTTPLLATGAYTLRIFSTQSGYAIFDTVVIVEKGAETKLPVIFLHSANAPSVGDFSVTLDSLTMYATFTWSFKNTDSIVSYSLYRKSKKGDDSLIMVDKSLTRTNDDVFLCEGDTLTYQIAANGKNFKEGFLSKPLVVVPRQKMRWNGRIPVKGDISRLNFSMSWLLVDYKGNMFLGDANNILKLDADGNMVKYYEPDSGYFSGNLFPIMQTPQADESGNIYVNEAYSVGNRIFKFDADLNKHKVLTLGDTSAEYPQQLTIAVAGNGNMLAISDSTGPQSGGETLSVHSRRVTVFDSSFAPHDEYLYKNAIPLMEVARFGDTIVSVSTEWDMQDFEPYTSILCWYDQKFKELSVVKNFDYLDNFQPPQHFRVKNSFGGPGGLIFSIGNLYDNNGVLVPPYSLLFVSTADKKLVARFLAPMLLIRSVYFDHAGNLYCVAQEDADVNLVAVIYRYPIAPLFGAGAQ